VPAPAFSNDFLDKYAKIGGTEAPKLERKAKILLPAPGIIGIIKTITEFFRSSMYIQPFFHI
jgi:hypothetical protein